MANLSQYTPVRIALPFIGGILLAIQLGLDHNTDLWVGLFGLCYLMYFGSYIIIRARFGLQWIPGCIAAISLVLSGICIVAILAETDEENDRVVEFFPSRACICRIDEKPTCHPNSFSCKATLLSFLDSLNEDRPVRAGILMYFKNDSSCLTLLPGDILVLSSGLQRIKGPSNPGCFDYRKYMFFQRIRWQTFAEQGKWLLLNDHHELGLKRYSQICKSWFREMLLKYHIDGNDLALASGLILGDKQDLEDDIIKEFSNAGAMHILSVSGLHVGIMYVMADRLLFFLNRGRHGRKIQQIAITILIWGYAFLTGLPPSVVRASLMFSLIALANMSDRSHDSFNTLAGAAFLQLWINPYSLVQVGFQLSYLAVLGIFMFYKRLNNLFSNSRGMVAYTWSVISVSLAAQLGTFPLASYYFHFFPLYFVATNLVVVPIAGVIVYLAIFLLIAGSLGIDYSWLGLPLKWGLQFLQRSVEIIQSIPGAVVDYIYLNELQVALIFIAIFGIYLWMALNQKKGSFYALSALILVFMISGFKGIERSERNEAVVYHITGHTAIDLLCRTGSLFICDSSLLSVPSKIQFNIKPYRDQAGVRLIRQVSYGQDFFESVEKATWVSHPFAQFGTKRIAFIDRNWQAGHIDEKISVDLAIVSGTRVSALEGAFNQLNIGMCIIDGSVPRLQAEKLYREAISLGILCHSTWSDGGYVLEW